MFILKALFLIILLLYCAPIFLVLALKRFKYTMLLCRSISAASSSILLIFTIIFSTIFKEDMVFKIQLFLMVLEFRIDSLSILPFFILGIISLASSLYMLEHDQGDDLNTYTVFYNLFILLVILTVVVTDIILFLFVWKAAILSLFFLMLFKFREREVIEASWVYLVLVCIFALIPLVLAVAFMVNITGETSIHAFKTKIQHSYVITQFIGYISLLFIIAFSLKAGLVPFHSWMLKVNSAVPGNIYILFSCILASLASYDLLKFSYYLLPISPHIGYAIIVLSMLSISIGALYGFIQTDIKKTITYLGIVQLGYTWLSIGLRIVLTSYGKPVLGSLAQLAGMYNLVSYSISYGLLLFLLTNTASHIVKNDHSNMLRYPFFHYINILTLIAILSLSNIPLFCGFVPKWLIYKSMLSSRDPGLIICAAIALLANMLTITYTIKLYKVILKKTTANIKFGKTTTTANIGMGFLAFLCLLLGIAPASILPILTTSLPHMYVKALIRDLTILPFQLFTDLEIMSSPVFFSVIGSITAGLLLYMFTPKFMVSLITFLVEKFREITALVENFLSIKYFVTLCNISYKLTHYIVSFITSSLSKYVSRYRLSMREVYIDEAILLPIIKILDTVFKSLSIMEREADLAKLTLLGFFIFLILAVIIFILTML